LGRDLAAVLLEDGAADIIAPGSRGPAPGTAHAYNGDPPPQASAFVRALAADTAQPDPSRPRRSPTERSS
ncbi:MAG TPA: hypothetical protein VN712_08225, partial [Dermatophilaceae bacterium]|nr:hypothetical protein [Dermatophilaceae bacterium]